MHQFQLRFSLLFCTFFETFREKPKKRSRVRPQGYKNTSKWTSRTPKRRPRINNLSPKVPPSAKIMHWTTRPLELASNCKHKRKLPRPGARRRRRRSAAVPCTSCQRVGPPLLESLRIILRLTSSRTDKINSLGACTHLNF